jgi:hypothetical protein
MDRALLLEHRERTVWRLAESVKLLTRQEALIERLHGEGRSTTDAEAFLSVFQLVHDAHRDGLARIDQALAAPLLPLN